MTSGEMFANFLEGYIFRGTMLQGMKGLLRSSRLRVNLINCRAGPDRKSIAWRSSSLSGGCSRSEGIV